MTSADRANGSASLGVEGLVAGYGEVIALDGISVTAGAAAITAVLGANGAGKTTLLRAVSGLIKPRRGRVLLGATDLAGRGPEQIVRAGIAHVPEGQGVIPELTVEENLRIGMMSWPRRPRGPRGSGGKGFPPGSGGVWGGSSPPGQHCSRGHLGTAKVREEVSGVLGLVRSEWIRLQGCLIHSDPPRSSARQRQGSCPRWSKEL